MAPSKVTLNAVILAVCVYVLASAVALADSRSAALPLLRTNLLVLHARDGRVVAVKSRNDWEKRRREILRGMQQIMGPLPDQAKDCPLEVKVEAEVDCGSYIRRLISYASEPGSRVPAYLLIPKQALQGQSKVPAVLALHPTDMEYGHRVLVEPLRAHYRAYGAELAQRGYLVLAPAYPLMAAYQPDLKVLGYQSGTMKAIWDNKRGLDLLDRLPFIKKGRIGALGHSLGGHNAIYTAVFDKRIRAVVSSCGFDSYVDYMDGKIKGWTSARYMPKLLDYENRLSEIPFDFHELIGALAPRPVFINAPLGDTNFKWRSVDAITNAAAPIFKLYGVPANLKVEHPDCGHDFPNEVRQQAYQFLDKALR